MPYISPEKIVQAKSVDLLSYLQAHDPGELVRCSGGYQTRTHDSLKISNGKWMWWSKGIGGRSALDYLMKVKGMEFLDAVETILGESCIVQPKLSPTPPKKNLILPDKSPTNDRVREYLAGRGISKSIIDDCINEGIIYESVPYHNVIFIGKDSSGQPRYAAYRGTNQSRIMGDCTGSDKSFSFRLVNPDSKSIHLFESAIDALSYATLIQMNGDNYRDQTLISLAGVYMPGANEQSKLPAALQKTLANSPAISRIYLHLDNDRAGREATRSIQNSLRDKYTVVDKPPKYGKDINDYLCHRLGIQPQKKRGFER